jgi:HEPN domain-containing protein
MNQEITVWWTQAQNDLRAAKKNIEIHEYNVSVFLCQQSLEKGLKALYFKIINDNPGQTHSLIHLAKETQTPQKFHNFLRSMMSQFTATRYPDATIGIPSELYDESFALEIFQETQEVINWISSKLI